jgi:acetoin utilization deacetylase AcuC-like enzyme
MFPDHDIFDAPDFQGAVFRNSKAAVLFHEDFLKHKIGNHPESPQRLVVMRNAIIESPYNDSLEWIEPRMGEETDVLRCHTRAYYELIRKASEKAAEGGRDYIVWLDPDTGICSESWHAAMRAVGASIQSVDMVMNEGYASAWGLVRPPGHHATPDRAMGFCLYNNASIAAEYARAVHNLERVMIVDYDLHHGNGTQEIFYSNPGVLYTSVHQSYHFPGTGHIDEIGSGDGRGYTVNFPVLAGSGDGEFALYFREIVAPIADQFKPQLLIASVGFDAHAADQLGFLRLSSPMYGKIVYMLRAIASNLGIGLIYLLEGGYSLEAQAESIVESMKATVAERFDPGELPMPFRPSQGSQAALERLRKVLKGIWEI